MKGFFITSSGTGVGKTLVVSLLCRYLLKIDKSVHAIKPVISGFSDSAEKEDDDLSYILGSLNMPVTKENVDKISLYRFLSPISPDMAAKREGKKIDFRNLKKFCLSFSDYDYLLVEGIGGAMVPLNDKFTVLGLMESLGFPVVLVIGDYLGSISHTLTTLEAIRNRGLQINSVVVSGSETPAVPFKEMEDTLKRFIKEKIIYLPRIKGDKDKSKYSKEISKAVFYE